MSLYDEKTILDIVSLTEADRLDGSEYILIQKEGEETKKITVDLLLSNLVTLMNTRGTNILNETDPTVPNHVKSITANQIQAWNSAVSDVQELSDRVTNVETSSVKISSFVCDPVAAEKGDVINSVTLTWETNNKRIIRIVLDNEEVDPSAYQITKQLNHVSEDTTFTLTVTADDGETATRTVTLPFEDAIYYGCSGNVEITSDFVNNLSGKVLQDDRFLSFTVLAREGEFIYVAFPSRFGSANFKYSDGTYAEFDFAKQIELVNKFNHKETYYVYRSRYIQINEVMINIV